MGNDVSITACIEDHETGQNIPGSWWQGHTQEGLANIPGTT